MTNARPLASGTPRRSSSIASSPPAEAPIAMTGGVRGGERARDAAAGVRPRWREAPLRWVGRRIRTVSRPIFYGCDSRGQRLLRSPTRRGARGPRSGRGVAPHGSLGRPLRGSVRRGSGRALYMATDPGGGRRASPLDRGGAARRGGVARRRGVAGAGERPRAVAAATSLRCSPVPALAWIAARVILTRYVSAGCDPARARSALGHSRGEPDPLLRGLAFEAGMRPAYAHCDAQARLIALMRREVKR